MAQVRLSLALMTEIKTNAEAPFAQIMQDVSRGMRDDPKILHEINIAMFGQEQTRLAEQLYNKNPDWFDHSYTYLTLVTPSANFDLDINRRPYGGKAGTRVNIDHTATLELTDYVAKLLIPYDRAVKDKAKIRELLTKIESTCVNLSQAEKVLPSILQWVPEHKLVLYRTKTVREKREFDPEAIRDTLLDDDTVVAISRRQMKDT